MASEDALDQFFAREPDALTPSRVAILDHANSRILDPHVLAAAFEAPLDERDVLTLGAEVLAVRPSFPSSSARPRASSGRDATTGRTDPLRSGDADAFTVVDVETGSLLGLVERTAPSRPCTKARCTCTSASSTVESLDLDERIASAASASVDWYTQVKKETDTTIEGAERVERQLGVEPTRRVSVTEQVVGFARKAVRDSATIDVTPMLMPEATSKRRRSGLGPEAEHLEGLEQMPKLLGTLHAAEHTLIALLPLWAM